MKKALSVLVSVLTVLSLCVIPVHAAELENVAPAGSYEVIGIYTDGEGKTSYPDETGDCLINGVYAQTASYDQVDFVGLNATSEGAKAQDGVTSVKLDLGQVYPIVKSAVSCSNLCSAGISAPEMITVSVSADGENWSEPIVAEYEFELIEGEVVKSIAKINAEVRYITFNFYHATNWVFIDEVEAYAGDITANDEENSENASEDSSNVQTPEKKAEINSDVIYISSAVISVVILIVVIVFTRKKK